MLKKVILALNRICTVGNHSQAAAANRVRHTYVIEMVILFGDQKHHGSSSSLTQLAKVMG